MLTVILLTYNHNDTISKAFDSILEQVVDFDYKIHVLDDCSTDGTTDVCRHYQAKYPDKIKLFANDTNLGVAVNFKQGLLRIKARYYAFLEGDDYWCDKNKLQKQVRIMEQNPDITICGHNTLVKDHVKHDEYPMITDSQKVRYGIADKFGVHPSSRVYRNTIDLTDLPLHMVFDTHLYMVYLARGDLYYIDEIMSVYNLTGEGFWSGKKRKEKRLLKLKYQYQTNKYFNFAYDYKYYQKSMLLRCLKSILGVRHGWFIYYNIKSVAIKLRYLFS